MPKIILGEGYDGYDNALENCGLETLKARREDKCLQYGLKSLLHPVHCAKFPVNPHVRDDTLGPRNYMPQCRKPEEKEVSISTSYCTFKNL